MRNFNMQAILLKKHRVGDKDFSCTLLSKGFGKISAWLKITKQNDNVDFFSILDIGLYRFNNKNRLTGVKVLAPNFKIRSDVEKFQDASFVLNFLNIITEQETGSEFFDKTVHVLEEINKTDTKYVKEKFFFEILKIAGYEFMLQKCSNCNLPLNSKIKQVYFSTGLGGIVCNICMKNKKIDAFLLDFETFQFIKNFSNNNYSDQLQGKLRMVMGRIIQDLFGVKLNSLEVEF